MEVLGVSKILWFGDTVQFRENVNLTKNEVLPKVL